MKNLEMKELRGHLGMLAFSMDSQWCVMHREDLPEPDEAIAAFLDRRLSPEPDRKELQKTIDALLRRGFAWQDIRRCLAQRGESVDGEPEE